MSIYLVVYPRGLRIWLQSVTKMLSSQLPKDSEVLSFSDSSSYPLSRNRQDSSDIMAKLVEETLMKIEPYKLVTITQLLVSRIEVVVDEKISDVMCKTLARIAAEFPMQSIWWLLPLKYFNYHKSENRENKKNKRAGAILTYVKKLDFEAWKKIDTADKFYLQLLQFGMSKLSVSVPDNLLKGMPENNVIVPCKRFLSPKMPEHKEVVSSNYNPFHPNPDYIVRMDPKVGTMASKEAPRKIVFWCRSSKDPSATKQRPFLIKNEPFGDVRKESRTIELVHFVNELLRKSNWTAGRDLKMKTYSIVPLCSRIGLLEWVEHTATIKKVVEDMWAMQSIPQRMSDISVDQTFDKRLKPEVFKQFSKTKPVLQEHFWDSSTNSDEWYDSVINYVKSTAIWSAFGYFIGLGDRHCDNILLHKITGKALHIDFDCIFNKGKWLPKPEIVEFRLTKNVEAPFGPFKSYGMFKFYFRLVLKVLYKQHTDLMEALDSFLYDPLIEKPMCAQSIAMDKIKQNITFKNYKSLEEAVDVLH